MRMSLTALVRSLAFLSVGATMLALGLSKVVPAVSPDQPLEASPRYVGVNGAALIPHHDQNYLLDTETGKLVEFGLPDESTLDFVTSRPRQRIEATSSWPGALP